jgi:spermidine synthase
MTGKSRKQILPVFLLFLLSGATSLAYQVVWTRELIRVFGATSLAISTVLAAFMAGLAIGSYFFGRSIDRRGNPLITYGALEMGIGIFALAFPLLLDAFNPLYRGLYPASGGATAGLTVARFLISFVIVLVPTTLMGGTLPVLSRYVTENVSGLAFRVGWLYSINTFGAVAGTFVTGFVLLPRLGIRSTTLVAVAFNFLIFVLSMLMARSALGARAGAPAVQAAAPGEAAPAGRRITGPELAVLLAFFFTGLAALSAEVIYTRVLKLVVGTTVYAFSTMLTAFLLGLALGSAVFARVAQRTSRPRLVFSVIVALIGVLVFASTVGFGKLPIAFMDIYEGMTKTWGNLIGVQFLLSFLILIIPTFFMGATFPLVARIYATDLSRVGARIGTAYAFNTVGAITGSLLGAFVFLTYLGVEKGMFAVALIYLAVGVLLFLTVAEAMRLGLRAAVTAAFIVVLVLLSVLAPKWDRKLMTTAVYAYAEIYGTREGMLEDVHLRKLEYYNEGPAATVSIERSQTVTAMRIDGKIDASSGGDMITQELIAHLPLLLHERPDSVLVVGLGSGVTLGSCETHAVKHIDCVELIESVIEAAHYFDDYCHNCQDDPRLSLFVGDGRNHVFLSSRKYDVLISQPTNPWIEGVGDLFTVEYFEACRRRLKAGGIMCCWVQVYHMGVDELKSVLKSYIHVFPNATLWFANESDIILIGSLGEPRYDLLVERMSEPYIAADLARVLVDEPEDILAMFLMDEPELAGYVEDVKGFHTDDNMLIEFSAGKRILQSTNFLHLENLVRYVRPRVFAGLGDDLNARIARHMRARRVAMSATLARSRGEGPKAVGLYDEAYAMAPRDVYVLTRYADVHTDVGDAFVHREEYLAAMPNYEMALAESVSYKAWMRYDGLAVVSYGLGNPEEALKYFDRVLDLYPDYDQATFSMAEIYLELGDTLSAVQYYERTLEIAPDRYDAANDLAWIYAVRGENLERARDLALMATVADPAPFNYDTLGWVYYRMGEPDRAREALETALEIDPGWVESTYHLALVYLGTGDAGTAKRLLDEVIRTDQNGYYRDLAREKLDEL